MIKENIGRKKSGPYNNISKFISLCFEILLMIGIQKVGSTKCSAIYLSK